jgi:hypothetical protein
VLQVRPNVDIWSLGAVFSEVAVWLVRSYRAVQEYRGARRKATRGTIAEQDGDCFHDGSRVLPLIREVHQELRSKIRWCDYVTATVLEMIQDMLMDATARPDVKHFWERSQRIIAEARRMCDEKTLRRTMSINSRGSRQPPPSISESSSTSSSVDGRIRYGQQSHPPMIYNDICVAEPERMNTSTGNFVSLPSTPRGSQRFEHTIRPNAHAIPHGLSAPQVLTQSSVVQPERIEKHRSVEGAFTRRYSPIVQDNRLSIDHPHSDRQHTNPSLSLRQTRGFSEGTLGNMGNSGRYPPVYQLPRTSTAERQNSASVRQASGHQNIFEDEGYNVVTGSPKQMDTQTPPVDSALPVTYSPTGQLTAHNGPVNEFQNAANPTSNGENQGLGLSIGVSKSLQPATKPPKLSISDALLWRSRKKEGLKPTLDGNWLLNRVQRRDHVNIHLFTSNQSS